MCTLPSFVELSRATLQGPNGSIVSDVDFQIGPGECVQIVGHSGQGKSVFLELLRGQHRLSSGTRRYPAFESDFPDAKLGIAPRRSVRLVSSESQRQISVSQSSFYQARWHSLWTEPQTVDAFLSERQVLGYRPYEVVEALPLGPEFAAMRTRLMQDLEISGLEGRLVAQLSNGELRKLMLVAACLAKPRLLLLDDPLGGLASSAQEQLTKILGTFVSEGNAVVYASAHERDLQQLRPKRLRLHAGKLGDASGAEAPAVSEQTRLTPGKSDDASDCSNAARLLAHIPERVDSAHEVASAEPLRDCVLNLVDVSVRMSGVTLLEGISWRVRAGQHWMITGPNGSGKSTLLALITGDHPQSYANDIDVLGSRLGQGESLWQRRRRIGYVAPELGWHYPRSVSLRELVLSGFDSSIGFHRAANALELESVDELLEQFSYTGQAAAPIGSLSEGTVRLALLMRAMVHRPKLLLLDEPTQELGHDEIARFLSQLDRIAEQGRSTIVLVTHQFEERPTAITHHLHLSGGHIAHMGPLHSQYSATAAR